MEAGYLLLPTLTLLYFYQGCTPRPALAPGKIAVPGRPSLKNFQDCPAPPRKCPEFNCYPAPPRGFYPNPEIFFLCPAPPRPEAKKGCPVHPRCKTSIPQCKKSKLEISSSKVFSFPGNWDTAGAPQHTPPLKMLSPILSPWLRSNAKEQKPNFKTAATPQTLRNSTAPQQLLSAIMIHNH